MELSHNLSSSGQGQSRGYHLWNWFDTDSSAPSKCVLKNACRLIFSYYKCWSCIHLWHIEGKLNIRTSSLAAPDIASIPPSALHMTNKTLYLFILTNKSIYNCLPVKKKKQKNTMKVNDSVKRAGDCCYRLCHFIYIIYTRWFTTQSEGWYTVLTSKMQFCFHLILGVFLLGSHFINRDMQTHWNIYKVIVIKAKSVIFIFKKKQECVYSHALWGSNVHCKSWGTKVFLSQ